MKMREADSLFATLTDTGTAEEAIAAFSAFVNARQEAQDVLLGYTFERVQELDQALFEMPDDAFSAWRSELDIPARTAEQFRARFEKCRRLYDALRQQFPQIFNSEITVSSPSPNPPKTS